MRGIEVGRDRDSTELAEVCARHCVNADGSESRPYQHYPATDCHSSLWYSAMTA